MILVAFLLIPCLFILAAAAVMESPRRDARKRNPRSQARRER